MVVIKNFGSDMECHSLSELKAALASKYVGKSVSLSSKATSGINVISYISVDEKGDSYLSYSDQRPFNLDDLKF